MLEKSSKKLLVKSSDNLSRKLSEKHTLEYQSYQQVQHWKPATSIIEPKLLFDNKSPYHSLTLYMYERTKKFYSRFPLRKNGDMSFIHPISVVLALKEANIIDEITLLAGLTHDIVEERVDLYRNEHQIKETPEGILILDQYEKTIYPKLLKELSEVCKSNNIDELVVPKIVSIIRLLTRHKRDFYYHSVSNIYNQKDEVLKEKAIMIKLADRTHNILSIECFSQEQRIYECFKNLFILNSTKKYILKKYNPAFLSHTPLSSLAILFKRCAKATYEAFLTICNMSSAKGIKDTTSMLQLAFKKFALEQSGATRVTNLNKKEMHPIRLYGGIIRKYDFRLQHQKELFDNIKKEECDYCENFFADFNFSSKQLHAIIDYKDAYALKETIAYLLYWPEYILEGFEYSDLFREN